MSLDGTSVLVVEDHDFQRRTLVRILQNLGAGEVLEAADGEDALRVLAAAPDGADVVVCDLELPGMDGVALLHHIGERAPGQAVVIASGLEGGVLEAAERTGRAHGLEVLATLAKPITAAGLLEAFGRRGPRAAATGGAAPSGAATTTAPVLELVGDATGTPTGVRVSGVGADEELVAVACRAHRRLARAGRPLPTTVVLPGPVGADAAARLAGRAALEGVAPRHLALVVPGTEGGHVDALRDRGFAVTVRPAGVSSDDGRTLGRAAGLDVLVALVGSR